MVDIQQGDAPNLHEGWPASVDKVPSPGVRTLVKQAGGWGKVLPRYIASRPRKRGLMLSEYLSLGLAERQVAEAKTFLGTYGAAQLALRLNRLSNRRGIIADKLLADAMFRGAGIETPDTLAVFGRPAPPHAVRLEKKQDLAAFLEQAGPVFGKPAMGDRGIDTIAIDGVRGDQALCMDGHTLPIDGIWARLRKSYRGSGFLFQRKIEQHPKITQMVGPTAATVRVMTVYCRGKVHIHGCAWRIPQGSAIADNFSLGGLAASVDSDSGRVSSAISTFRADAPRISVHPTTGVAFEDVVLPRWLKVKKTVRAAAGMMHVLPVIGWDLAIAPHGPIIVEANASPSLEAPQYLTGQGALAGKKGEILMQVLEDVERGVKNHKSSKRARRREMVKSWLSKS